MTKVQRETFQGKPLSWWVARTQANRKEANAKAQRIKQLQKTLQFTPSVEESIKLATLIYPALTETRAWCLIKHESWMASDPLHAKNPSSTATGLYQFLTSTFMSTPFGKAGMSIYSPYAQSLAAGWMHQNGRGGEWDHPDC